ncbi:MAG: glutamine--fructose-6-phosphate transaminase (isomerizing) [Coriobacteriales bacterium]|jgi:glucosamine--fructose-6-phosphate aminotransferase (isomerizing)
MCGIVGFTGAVDCKDFLLDGLFSLEYRGYDSAGIAVQNAGGDLDVVCRVGKVASLKEAVMGDEVAGTCGIGHTRWATHGVANERNAHPHTDCTGRIAVVHNGIIENYTSLRDELIAGGHEFKSDTDTEVIAHLIEEYYEGDFTAAMVKTIARLEGAYGIAAVHADHPGIIMVTRKDSPIVVASSLKGAFVASDTLAVIEHTRDVVYLDDDNIAVLHANGGIDFMDAEGKPIVPVPVHIDWDAEAAGRAGFPDFMLKEINEQPRVISDTIADRVVDGRLQFPELDEIAADVAAAETITIVACGTSYHAGLIARELIERWTRIPVNVEVASEFRYRDPVVTPKTLVIAITQSGETADTIEAIKISRAKGAKAIALTNVVGSRATRESDAVLYIKANREISVAATKSFTAQNALLALVALYLAQERQTLPQDEILSIYHEMEEIPSHIEWILHQTNDIRRCAKVCLSAHSMMYIGRGFGDVTCKEGALKIKEISYIHAEAYAAGEIKHGPIALIDENVPVVAMATQSPVYKKVISNIVECKSRGAKIIAVATEGDTEIKKHTDFVMYVPPVPDYFSPLTASVSLQLLAREVAVRKGRDIDHPRNLAKSVTVE